jgi:tetraacyldisaccharide 4'-kinase
MYAAWRALRKGAYWRTFRERFGFLPASIPTTKAAGIWLHAVSVGEVISAVPLIRRFRTEFPATPIFVSTTTIAGRQLADQRLAATCDGIFYLPIDFPFAIRRVLRRIEPVLFINLETELWPNLIREVKRSGAYWMQLNARISDRAWPRYRSMRWLWRAVLPQMDFVAAQSAQDAARFRELGFPGTVHELGNLKFDFEPNANQPPADILAWLQQPNAKPLWVAASTMPAARADDPDEDAAVLDAYNQLNGEVRLLLAPRRTDRFDTVAGMLQSRGIPFERRTTLNGTGDVLLLDSIGELSSLFRYAHVVFVGGTLVDRGGHNVLEPASFGKPVFVGPNMQNFPEITRILEQANALRRIPNAEAIAVTVRELIRNPEPLASNAHTAAANLKGVSERLLPHIRTALSAGVNLARPPLQSLARPFALPWRIISQRSLPTHCLDRPVISIGNLGMGGTGKTPTTLAIAERLDREGLRVGILTRGYGRTGNRVLALPPGTCLPWRESGDEAQLYLAGSRFAVGIAADRFRAGVALLRQTEVDVFLLDDGFQHRQLHRDFDLVLVDATKPCLGLDVPPAGWLREPWAALRRAHAIALTRCRQESAYAGLRALLPPQVPHYRTQEIATAPAHAPDCFAFCGLGNPAGFRQTLDSLHLNHVPLEIFPDHHPYTAADIERLRATGRPLLTTEKDAVKLRGRLEFSVVTQRMQLPEPLWQQILATAKGRP